MIKETPNINYELIGGVNHIGEYNGGHYTCFALNNNKWWNYNDSNVSEIDIDKTDIPQSQHAYMLVYKQYD
jgi:ubiquitin C-terminal hydrolase